jgi:hypothetical protein
MKFTNAFPVDSMTAVIQVFIISGIQKARAITNTYPSAGTRWLFFPTSNFGLC